MTPLLRHQTQVLPSARCRVRYSASRGQLTVSRHAVTLLRIAYTDDLWALLQAAWVDGTQAMINLEQPMVVYVPHTDHVYVSHTDETYHTRP